MSTDTKASQTGGDEDPLEEVTLHPVSQPLALVRTPAVVWVPEFGKPVWYDCG